MLLLLQDMCLAEWRVCLTLQYLEEICAVSSASSECQRLSFYIRSVIALLSLIYIYLFQFTTSIAQSKIHFKNPTVPGQQRARWGQPRTVNSCREQVVYYYHLVSVTEPDMQQRNVIGRLIITDVCRKPSILPICVLLDIYILKFVEAMFDRPLSRHHNALNDDGRMQRHLIELYISVAAPCYSDNGRKTGQTILWRSHKKIIALSLFTRRPTRPTV